MAELQTFWQKLKGKRWYLVPFIIIGAVAVVAWKFFFSEQPGEGHAAPEVQGVEDSWRKADSDPVKQGLSAPLTDEELNKQDALIAAEMAAREERARRGEQARSQEGERL